MRYNKQTVQYLQYLQVKRRAFCVGLTFQSRKWQIRIKRGNWILQHMWDLQQIFRNSLTVVAVNTSAC
jgi:hypothetical protein